MTIHTSFVMAIFNRAELLNTTMHGYRRYAYSHEGVELVVADYGSTDNVKLVLEEARGVFKRIRYLRLDRAKSAIPIHPEFNNPSVALNVGARVAEGGLLVFSPPECYPLADNLHAARSIMEGGRRKVSLLGRGLKSGRAMSERMGCGKWLPTSESDLSDRRGDKEVRVSSSMKAFVSYFLAVRKQDHERLNGFDEEYARGLGAEDNDYMCRLRNAGAPHIWSDRCVVVHQWHKPANWSHPECRFGTEPGAPNWRRDGVRANLNHTQGSRAMILSEITI